MTSCVVGKSKYITVGTKQTNTNIPSHFEVKAKHIFVNTMIF